MKASMSSVELSISCNGYKSIIDWISFILLRKMFTDDEFSYFGDEATENIEDNDSDGRQDKFDGNGKRVRGRDQEWINTKSYHDPESFKSSDLFYRPQTELFL